MANAKQHPHYQLEDTATGLPLAQTAAGYRVAKPKEADKYTQRIDAVIAAGALPVDVVRVDG